MLEGALLSALRQPQAPNHLQRCCELGEHSASTADWYRELLQGGQPCHNRIDGYVSDGTFLEIERTQRRAVASDWYFRAQVKLGTLKRTTRTGIDGAICDVDDLAEADRTKRIAASGRQGDDSPVNLSAVLRLCSTGQAALVVDLPAAADV